MSNYPQNPEEWQLWIKEKLGISYEEGMHWTRVLAFPIERLVEAWKDEFSVEKGFVRDFIPALYRNVRGFLTWVYSGGSEPNWKGSDSEKSSSLSPDYAYP
jgi:hypothetical protein